MTRFTNSSQQDFEPLFLFLLRFRLAESSLVAALSSDIFLGFGYREELHAVKIGEHNSASDLFDSRPSPKAELTVVGRL